ncbi:MAG: hypothetical protein O3A85_14700 [Proteobacteria bacterium]|nr:hypothetical protein [Pseudomonadota bacterium]
MTRDVAVETRTVMDLVDVHVFVDAGLFKPKNVFVESLAFGPLFAEYLITAFHLHPGRGFVFAHRNGATGIIEGVRRNRLMDEYGNRPISLGHGGGHAAAQGHKQAEKNKSVAEGLMSAADISRAKKLAKDWKAGHP